MALKSSAQKVQDTLSARGFDNRVIELPDSARTASAAAAAVGCQLAIPPDETKYRRYQSVIDHRQPGRGGDRAEIERTKLHGRHREHGDQPIVGLPPGRYRQAYTKRRITD